MRTTPYFDGTIFAAFGPGGRVPAAGSASPPTPVMLMRTSCRGRPKARLRNTCPRIADPTQDRVASFSSARRFSPYASQVASLPRPMLTVPHLYSPPGQPHRFASVPFRPGQDANGKSQCTRMASDLGLGLGASNASAPQATRTVRAFTIPATASRATAEVNCG